MSDEKTVSYKCPDCGKTWSGIEGVIPTDCPECGEVGEIIDLSEGENSVDDSTPAEDTETTSDTLNPPLEAVEVETATYKITGLVDVFNEQGEITGQLPIGSEQELPVEYGDKCVENGTAEKVSKEEVE